MKYLLICAIILSNCFAGCVDSNNITESIPTIYNNTLCSNSPDCLSRFDKLVCAIKKQTEEGKIVWDRANRGQQHYFVYSLTNDAYVYSYASYMSFDIRTKEIPGKFFGLTVDNICAAVLYMHLTEQTEKIEVIKRKAIQDFLDVMEKQYEISMETK
jgi:hypothetical protein